MTIPVNKLYWQIRGYDSTTLLFERTVELGQFTDDQIKRLLKALVAKAGLSYDEMVGAYAKRRTKVSNDLLTAHKDIESNAYTCGSNPHFVAAITDESGIIVRHLKLS